MAMCKTSNGFKASTSLEAGEIKSESNDSE